MKRRFEDSKQQPYGIQPLGNQYLGTEKKCRDIGLGDLACLSDELCQGIFGLLESQDLYSTMQVSKSMYVFSHLSEVWRYLVLCQYDGQITYRTSWYDTFRSMDTRLADESRTTDHVPLQVQGFYSDTLYYPWLCHITEMDSAWLRVSNVERRSAESMSREEFAQKYEEPRKPVILTGTTKDWTATSMWTSIYLSKHCGNKLFSVQSVDMTMKDYFRYAEQTNDERPMYLFDYDFALDTDLGRHFDVPLYFKEDLFSILGPRRPNYRWLIIGPKHSGSTFHKDPNATSAWNAAITGRKKWILFPPHITPPGVRVSRDGAMVMTPLSPIEWFMNYYDEATHGFEPYECIVNPGEVMFVPSGWWHMVINLETSIAITQNYVTSANLAHVVRFLHSKPDQVSGYHDCERLCSDFVDALARERPDLFPVVQKAKEAPVSLWKQLNTQQNTGFTFGFSS